jgi:hypothetical protein
MRRSLEFVVLLTAISLAACATIANVPINSPASDLHAGLARTPDPVAILADDGLLIGLAFSEFDSKYVPENQKISIPRRRGSNCQALALIGVV